MLTVPFLFSRLKALLIVAVLSASVFRVPAYLAEDRQDDVFDGSNSHLLRYIDISIHPDFLVLR